MDFWSSWPGLTRPSLWRVIKPSMPGARPGMTRHRSFYHETAPPAPLLIGDAGRLGLHHDQSAERHALCRRDQQSRTAGVGASRGRDRRLYQTLWLKRLVFAEPHETIVLAIQREKNLKHRPRAWKLSLILDQNPNWDDLYDRLS